MLGRTNRRIDAITLRRTGGVAPIDRVCPRESYAYAYGCRSTDRRRHQERIRANARVAPGIFERGGSTGLRSTRDNDYALPLPFMNATHQSSLRVHRADQRETGACVPYTCTPSTDVERIAAINSVSG